MGGILGSRNVRRPFGNGAWVHNGRIQGAKWSKRTEQFRMCGSLSREPSTQGKEGDSGYEGKEEKTA